MNTHTNTYYSHGKLLLTGEYVILDGAKGLALPTKLGQSLKVSYCNSFKGIHWKSFNYLGELWYEGLFNFDEKNRVLKATNDNEITKRIQQIFKVIFRLKPDFLKTKNGVLIETHLEFERLWGLGTSSTLINNLASWAKVDAYKLLDQTFGGSGYDIACAQHRNSLTYQIQDQNRIVKKKDFNPPFQSNLYLVYLNQKQNSRQGIAHYKTQQKDTDLINEVTKITNTILKTTCQIEFNRLLNQHEQCISKTINLPSIQEAYFSDFDGQIKSLGAWGGDFVLASCFKNPTDYFKNKGFKTVLKYNELIS